MPEIVQLPGGTPVTGGNPLAFCWIAEKLTTDGKLASSLASKNNPHCGGIDPASRDVFPVHGASGFRYFSCAAITRLISISIALEVTGLAT